MNSETPLMSLKDAGIKLIDCVHKTPVAADQGFPYIAIPQLSEGRVDVYSARRISEQDMLEWNVKCNPQEDDIVLSRRCNPGVTAVIPKGFRGSLGQNLVLLRATDTNLLTPKYLRWVTRGREWWNEVDRYINVGAVFESLRCADIPEFAIPVPSIAEQRAIAHILGTLDDKIELNRKTNETLEAMAKALFKSWFVDFDPVRAKAEGRSTGLPSEINDLFPDSFEDSELGEIPSRWEPRTISEWGRTECGKTPSTHNREFYGGDHMFVTIPDLHNGLHVVSSGKQLSKLGADSQRKKLLPPGSVMVSCIATPGLVGVAKETCFTNQQINAIIPNSKQTSWFLALAMIENRDLLLSLGGGGSVFFNLSKGRFDEIKILAPSDDLLGQFNGVVSTLMDGCFSIKQETITLTKTRDALLPKLISGEIRIPDAEKMLEEVGI